MTVYAWPSAWVPCAFELRILPNTRTFVGAYTPVVQVVDLLGERWQGRIDLPPTTDLDEAGAREAFFDRLKGPANQFSIWNFRRAAPRGTARGTLTLAASAAQGANAVSVAGSAAGATYRAGDMLGINGQLVRVMADATANGSGVASLEIQPRLRAAQSSGASVAWSAPTCNVMLKGDGVATTYHPGYADGCSIEFVEVP